MADLSRDSQTLLFLPTRVTVLINKDTFQSQTYESTTHELVLSTFEQREGFLHDPATLMIGFKCHGLVDGE